ncbi:sporulation protein YpjB [Tepidibacillus marianensis]|uniref:sporulation protein YpjB n=1 Tax=Tepidibacillus marianensis TaxID=3131995 RepID=UPI0030CEAD3D
MIKKVGYLTLTFILLFLFNITSTKANNSESPSVITIQKLTQNLITFVEMKDFEKAKLTAEQLSAQLTAVSYKGITSVEGMEAITSTTIQVKRNLAALSPNMDRISFSTIQLQLAIDALDHKEQPLWKRYYTILKTDLNDVEKALSNNKTEQMNAAIQKYERDYQLIRPAIQVSKPAYVVEKMDSLHTALTSQRVDQNKEILISQLKEAIDDLFYGNEKDVIGKVVEEKTLWNTTFGIGLLIFIALSYVIWKKFKASDFKI